MNRQIKIYKDAIKNSKDAYELIDKLHAAIKATGDDVTFKDYISEDQTYAENFILFKNGLSIMLITKGLENTTKVRMYDNYKNNYKDIIIKTLQLSREAC